MTNFEEPSFLQRVERYEAAVKELEAAQEGAKVVLLQHVLVAQWQQLGAQLGVSAAEPAPQGDESNRDLQQLNQQISAMSESWAQ